MSNIPTPEKIVITVCIPTHDNVSALWAYDLAGMLTYTVAMLGDRIALRVLMITGTYIAQARGDLIDDALEKGTHYVLFIDSDMRFPRDALIRLLSHDRDVVGVNYPTRVPRPQFVAIATQEIPEEHLVVPGDARANRLKTMEDDEGLVKAHALGGGLLLMKAHVFNDLPRPMFQVTLDEDNHAVGEDVHFCRLLGEKGIDIWCDQYLSNQIGHVGSFTYMTTHAADEWRRAEEEAHGAGELQRSENSDRDAPQPD